MTKGIRRFLKKWKATKGFGLKWRLTKWGNLRSEEGCCPLTAPLLLPSTKFKTERCLEVNQLEVEDANWIAAAADKSATGDTRKQLLSAVGLKD